MHPELLSKMVTKLWRWMVTTAAQCRKRTEGHRTDRTKPATVVGHVRRDVTAATNEALGTPVRIPCSPPPLPSVL